MDRSCQSPVYHMRMQHTPDARSCPLPDCPLRSARYSSSTVSKPQRFSFHKCCRVAPTSLCKKQAQDRRIRNYSGSLPVHYHWHTLVQHTLDKCTMRTSRSKSIIYQHRRPIGAQGVEIMIIIMGIARPLMRALLLALPMLLNRPQPGRHCYAECVYDAIAGVVWWCKHAVTASPVPPDQQG